VNFIKKLEVGEPPQKKRNNPNKVTPHIYPKPDEPMPEDIKKLREEDTDRFISTVFEWGVPLQEDKVTLKIVITDLEEKIEKRNRSEQYGLVKPIKQTEHVYILKMGGDYKIGYTKEIGKRVDDIVEEYNKKRPALSRRVELFHTIPTNDGRKLESKLHKRFQSKRIGGEWFRLDTNYLFK
jgi:hypothetical protein